MVIKVLPSCPSSTGRFQEYGALDTLVGLLNNQPVDVLVNVVGALGEFAQIPANKANIHRCGGIKVLIKLLRSTNQACGIFLQLRRDSFHPLNTLSPSTPSLPSPPCQYIHKCFLLLLGFRQALLINVTTAVGSCAMDMTNMA